MHYKLYVTGWIFQILLFSLSITVKLSQLPYNWFHGFLFRDASGVESFENVTLHADKTSAGCGTFSNLPLSSTTIFPSILLQECIRVISQLLENPV